MSADPNATFRAGDYERGMLPFWDRVLTSFYRSLPDREPGSRLLDVGAGRGLLVSLAHADGLDAHGVDPFWPDPIDPHVVRGVAEALPFPDSSFDLVTCFSVIEYVERPAVALEEMARVLRPDGRIVIAVPELESYRWLRRDRYRQITSAQWFREILLPLSQLEIEQVRGLGIRYVVPVGRRSIGRLIPRWTPVLLSALYVHRFPQALADLSVFSLRLRRPPTPGRPS